MFEFHACSKTLYSPSFLIPLSCPGWRNFFMLGMHFSNVLLKFFVSGPQSDDVDFHKNEIYEIVLQATLNIQKLVQNTKYKHQTVRNYAKQMLLDVSDVSDAFFVVREVFRGPEDHDFTIHDFTSTICKPMFDIPKSWNAKSLKRQNFPASAKYNDVHQFLKFISSTVRDVVKTNNVILEEKTKQLIESNNLIQEEKTTKLVESNNLIQEEKTKKLVESNSLIQEEKTKKLVESNNLIQKESFEKTLKKEIQKSIRKAGGQNKRSNKTGSKSSKMGSKSSKMGSKSSKMGSKSSKKSSKTGSKSSKKGSKTGSKTGGRKKK